MNEIFISIESGKKIKFCKLMKNFYKIKIRLQKYKLVYIEEMYNW